MPTSAALDVVAKHLNLKFFEVFSGHSLKKKRKIIVIPVLLATDFGGIYFRCPLAGNSLVI